MQHSYKSLDPEDGSSLASFSDEDTESGDDDGTDVDKQEDILDSLLESVPHHSGQKTLERSVDSRRFLTPPQPIWTQTGKFDLGNTHLFWSDLQDSNWWIWVAGEIGWIDLRSEKVLLKLARAGGLLHFLRRTNMPLHKHPSVASGYLEEAEHALEHCEGLEAMHLISNYLLVPSLSQAEQVSVKKMLQKYLREMIVFRHVRSPGSGQYVQACEKKMAFPQQLGVLFFKRMFRWHSSHMTFSRRTLKIEDRSEGSLVFKTLSLEALCMKRTKMRHFMIPVRAEQFTFVYPNEHYKLGGFLYLDRSGIPLAVNWLIKEPSKFAMSFGKSEELSQEAAEILKQNDRWIEVTMPEQIEAGAKRYSFIPPGDSLTASLKYHSHGGFVYHIEKQGSKPEYKFFGINFSGEIEARCTLFKGQDMRAAKMEKCPLAQKFTAQLLEKRGIACFNRRVEVKLARLDLPGALHPCVLHGLAYTPYSDLLETIEAKAIASAAYKNTIISFTIRQFCILLSIGAITQVTLEMRNRSNEDEEQLFAAPHWTTRGRVCFGLILLVYVKGMIEEFLLWYGLRKWGWIREYVTSITCFINVFFLAAATLLVISMFVRKGHVSRDRPFRLLLGATGCSDWLTLLLSLREMEAFNLGHRLLPILQALGEVLPFLIVTLFLFCASVQASYAITDSKLSQILYHTYRMGFVGDIHDSLFFEDGGVTWSSDSLFHFFFYFFFSFVVMVSLGNIFIQVMGSAFDDAEKQVGTTFVRRRLISCVHRLLKNHVLRDLFACRHKDDTDSCVWCAFTERPTTDDDLA